MKIIFYCQHVLGMGHFFRSVEISKAMSEHQVILVTGGKAPDVEIPPHIRQIRLPDLMMDPDFSGLYTTEKNMSVEKVKDERKRILFELLESEKPEIFIVELYPFGRKAFAFELDPVLENIRAKQGNRCRSVCSLRDILVEKKDPEKHEKRVIKLLNDCFDALLVHADPTVFSLHETFSRVNDIKIPLVYTGFVTSKPPDDACRRVRRRLKIGQNKKMVIASAGGGKVGFILLKAVLEAAFMIKNDIPLHLKVFSGPFMNQNEYSILKEFQNEDFSINRFTPDFLSYLAAADLSVSMAGYNTCMNILAANTPAIVWPFSQNREQRIRAEGFAKKASFTVLCDKDLITENLAMIMRKRLLHKETPNAMVNLEGSLFTAKWLKNWIK